MYTKKLGKIFVCLLIIYLLIEIFLNTVRLGHQVTYQIKDNKQKILVEETYKRKNYHRYDFVYTIGNTKFYQTFYGNLKNRNYVVQQVKYVKDDKYECIYPIYKEKGFQSDVVCYDGRYYYPYQALSDVSPTISEFYKKYKGNQVVTGEKSQEVTIYSDNLLKNHQLFLENYKGLYFISDVAQVKNLTLFDKDVYKKDLSCFNKDYYFVADYNDKYATNRLLFVSLKDRKIKELKKKESLSFDSVVQGVVDEKIYVLDKSNKEQYKIDLKNETIKKIGTEKQKLSVFKDGKWEKQNYYQVVQEEKMFFQNEVASVFKNIQYDRVDYVKGKKYEFYYLYLKDGDKYQIYRYDCRQKTTTYLFKTTSLKNIYYHENIIYFIDGENIFYYSDFEGLNKVITYRELQFNSSLQFYVTF